MNRRLVSFCLKSYNQKQYIGSALKGAFSQDYRPLEIVVSDDASSDGSDKVIKSMIAEYHAAGGDIPIVYNRNETNLGNLGNWQKICSLAHGEILVKADGDDISLPNRVSRVVEEWFRIGSDCGVMFHNAEKFDLHGIIRGDVKKEVFVRRLPLGAVMSCSRRCYDAFGPCFNPRGADDIVYANRAKLLGLKEHRFDEVLVRYRVGCGESTVAESYSKALYRTIGIAIRSLECEITDLDCVREHLEAEEYQRQKAELHAKLLSVQNELPMWDSANFLDRLQAFYRTHHQVRINKVFFVHLFLLLPCKIGQRILDVLYKLVSKL